MRGMVSFVYFDTGLSQMSVKTGNKKNILQKMEDMGDRFCFFVLFCCYDERSVPEIWVERL